VVEVTHIFDFSILFLLKTHISKGSCVSIVR